MGYKGQGLMCFLTELSSKTYTKWVYGSGYDFKMLDPINVHQNQFVAVKAAAKL